MSKRDLFGESVSVRKDTSQVPEGRVRVQRAERTNADLKNGRGLDSLPVRGIGKVMCVAVWSTITFNLRRWMECAT